MLRVTPLRVQGAMTERFFLKVAARGVRTSGATPRDMQQ
jgi:hypothetical protein